MKLLQEDLVNYIFKLLGVGLKLEKWPKATALPRFIFDNYDFYCADLLEMPHLFLLGKSEKENTPASIRKQVALVREKYSGEVVLVCPLISPHNRNRLLEYKIPFIIPGNQLYLPASGMALREYFRQPLQKKELFSPSAQVVVLHAIIRNRYGPMAAARLVHDLHYSAMTLTRAFDEIEASELGAVEHRGRERILLFTEKGENLWEKALPFFRSPVKKSIFLIPGKRAMNYYKAGLTALAELSMIVEPEQTVYALSVEQFKAIEFQNDLEIIPYPEPGSVCLEIWRYSPDILGQNNIVDSLSLYLSLKDNTDERVVAEAQTMVEAFFDKGN